MNKKFFYLIILFSVCSFLFSNTIEEDIDNSLRYLELFPDDLTERYELAYLYSLMGQTENAETQYHYVLERDSLNTGAWIGYLWSMSLQGRNKEVLSFEKNVVKLTQKNPSILNIMAFSHGSSDHDYAAIYYYRQVLKDSTANDTERFLANRGISGHYYWTGDYYRYRKINEMFNQPLSIEEKQDLIPLNVFLYSGLSLGRNTNHTDFQIFNQWISTGALEAEFIVDNKRYDSKQAITTYSLKLNNHYYPVNLSSQFFLINSQRKVNETEIDGFAGQFRLSKPFYPYRSKLEPFTALSLTTDGVQWDTGAILDFDKLILGFDINHLRVWCSDNIHSDFDLYYKVSPLYSLQLSSGFGDNSNMISSNGQFNDQLSSSREFYQLNNFFYLKRYILSLSYNRSLMDKWTDAYMMSLGIRY